MLLLAYSTQRGRTAKIAVDRDPSALWPADSPAVTTHVTLLQGIISRLSNNSASSKTWCITIVAALLSLAGALRSAKIVSVNIVPIVVFAVLDVFYLATEKAYRGPL